MGIGREEVEQFAVFGQFAAMGGTGAHFSREAEGRDGTGSQPFHMARRVVFRQEYAGIGFRPTLRTPNRVAILQDKGEQH